MSGIFIYWGSGSIPCWRPLLVMSEKGIPYEEKLLEFSKKEHKSEEVTKLNPRGQLPTFKDGDVIIHESMAIIDYLETKYKDKGTQLYPDDPKEFAAVKQKSCEAFANLDKIISGIIYYQLKTKKEDVKQEVLDEGYKNAHTELDKWNSYLENSSFIVGDSFTMADVMLFTYIAFFWRMGLQLNKFPNLESYFNRHRERDSVKKTWPPHWASSDNGSMLTPI